MKRLILSIFNPFCWECDLDGNLNVSKNTVKFLDHPSIACQMYS